MSFAFMPIYSGDYLRDTRHLTPMKHGIYFLLLMHCWDQKGPLPLDEQEIAGIANCRSADEIDALRYVLSRYFIVMEDGFYNKRIQKEIERAEIVSVKRGDAGRRGANERMRRFREAQANAKQVLSTCQASDATPTPTPTPTPTTRKKPAVPDGTATAHDKRGQVVPYQKIVDLYHEILPMLPKCVALSEARRSQIRARYSSNHVEDLEDWRALFDRVARSKFLTGRVDPTPGRKAFMADLEWITKEGNFLKIVEGKYQ